MSTERPNAELIEAIMRDFKLEAPGRSAKSASRMNADATAIRRLEEKSFTTPLLNLREEFHRHLTNWSVRFQRVSSKKCSTTLPRKRMRSLHAVFRY